MTSVGAGMTVHLGDDAEPVSSGDPGSRSDGCLIREYEARTAPTRGVVASHNEGVGADLPTQPPDQTLVRWAAGSGQPEQFVGAHQGGFRDDQPPDGGELRKRLCAVRFGHLIIPGLLRRWESMVESMSAMVWATVLTAGT